MKNSEDILWVTRVLLWNDERAFRRLMEKYLPQVRRYFLVQTMGNQATSDDLTQETFIKAWQGIGGFRRLSSFSTWLYRIAINETLNFLAKNTDNTVSLDSPEGAVAEMLESDTHFNGDRADALLQEAISRLPDKQRLAFNMKYYENMKYEKMSEILGTSVGALKASYHHAYNKIREKLEKIFI